MSARGTSRRGLGCTGAEGISADSCGTTRMAPLPVPSIPSTSLASAWIHAFASSVALSGVAPSAVTWMSTVSGGCTTETRPMSAEADSSVPMILAAASAVPRLFATTMYEGVRDFARESLIDDSAAEFPPCDATNPAACAWYTFGRMSV